MNASEVLSMSLAVLAVLVSIHLSVFWMVKFMYPPIAPAPKPVPVVAAPPVLETPPTLAAAIAQAEFTLPPYETRKPQAPNVFTVGQEKQEGNVPTYSASIPLDVARSEIPGTTDIASLQDRPPV
uniref:Uncharacterized protein n=1 Tax=viral metagenome TaxID=1070528 RepID=A0A6C0J571_9ZZZZ